MCQTPYLFLIWEWVVLKSMIDKLHFSGQYRMVGWAGKCPEAVLTEWWDIIFYVQIRLKENDSYLQTFVCHVRKTDLFCIIPKSKPVSHECRVRWSIFGIAVGRISEVPERGRVHLFLLLAEVLKRTGDCFLSRLGWHICWAFRQHWELLAKCLLQNYKIDKFSGLTFGSSDSLSVGPTLLHFYRSSQMKLPGLRYAALFDLDSAFHVSFPVDNMSSFMLDFAYPSLQSFSLSFPTHLSPSTAEVHFERKHTCYLLF